MQSMVSYMIVLQKQVTLLRIKGEVGKAPESGVPVDNSGAPTNN